MSKMQKNVDIRNLPFDEKVKSLEKCVSNALKKFPVIFVNLNDTAEIMFANVEKDYMVILTLNQINDSNINVVQQAYTIANSRVPNMDTHRYNNLHTAVETVLTYCDQLGLLTHNEPEESLEM